MGRKAPDKARTTLFYVDQLQLTAAVLRDDADLGRFFRYVIKTIETGEKPDFAPDDIIVKSFYENWLSKYEYKLESDQNANRLKALGRRAEIAKSKNMDINGFAEYANSGDYTYSDEELAQYFNQFSGTYTYNQDKKETVTSAPVPQQEKPKNEDPAKIGFFEELWHMFPKDRQKDIDSIPYETKEMLYNTYGQSIKQAVKKYVETLTDTYHGHLAKTFFLDEMYKEYLPEDVRDNEPEEEEYPIDGRLITEEEWHDWQTGRLSEKEVRQICKERKESGDYLLIDDDPDDRQ